MSKRIKSLNDLKFMGAYGTEGARLNKPGTNNTVWLHIVRAKREPWISTHGHIWITHSDGRRWYSLDELSATAIMYNFLYIE